MISEKFTVRDLREWAELLLKTGSPFGPHLLKFAESWESTLDSFRKIERVHHLLTDDGEGYVSDWIEPDVEGEFVRWVDIETILKDAGMAIIWY